MKSTMLLLSLVGTVTAFGQTQPPLVPELAPYAARHKADLAALETQKVTSLARSRKEYLTALDFAEQSVIPDGVAMKAIKDDGGSFLRLTFTGASTTAGWGRT